MEHVTQAPHEGEVPLNNGVDPRSPDLHGHLTPGGPQARLVELSDGGRGERSLLERAEDGVEWAAELGLDDASRHFAREPAGAILQETKLVAEIGGQDVAADCDQLAELDPQSTHPLEHAPQGGGGLPPAPPPAQPAPHA